MRRWRLVMCRNPLSQNPEDFESGVGPHRCGERVAELAIEGTMGGGQVGKQERGLQHIQLRYPVPEIAGGEVAHEHLPRLDQIEQIGVGPPVVHDVPGDVDGDVALGSLLDGPLEGVETVAVGALTWPVAPNPQCFPAHPDTRGRCRGGSCLLWSIIDRI